jgi:predicted aldo/keto reductase-like oxidoreductase
MITLTSQADQKEIKKVREALGSKFCHRCDYCQPCTAGIPIFTVMTVKSSYKRLPPESFNSPMISNAMEKAVNCTQCGECEKRCPYHLPIQEIIVEEVAWVSGHIEAAAKRGKCEIRADGASDRIRTYDPRFTKAPLWPTELRWRVSYLS